MESLKPPPVDVNDQTPNTRLTRRQLTELSESLDDAGESEVRDVLKTLISETTEENILAEFRRLQGLIGKGSLKEIKSLILRYLDFLLIPPPEGGFRRKVSRRTYRRQLMRRSSRHRRLRYQHRKTSRTQRRR